MVSHTLLRIQEVLLNLDTLDIHIYSDRICHFHLLHYVVKREKKKNHLKTYAKKAMLTTNNRHQCLPEWQEFTQRDG